MTADYRQVVMSNGVRFLPRVVTAGDLDGAGVLTLVHNGDAADAARPWLILEEGLTLKGIGFVQGDPATDITASLDGQLITIDALGAGAMLVHEDMGVTAAHRFNVFPAASVVGIDRRPIQLLYSATESRWWVSDWGAYTGDVSNFASHPGTMTTAIESMAAALAGLLGGPIPN
jgi:hypothetical protein